MVTIGSDGAYSYVPNAALQSLAAGESQSDSFTYEVDDGQGGSTTATINITVNGANDTPVAVSASTSGSEDASALTGNLSASDVDGSDTLTFSLASGGAPTSGVVTIGSDGAYSYVPNAALQSLAAGESQSDSFTYEVDDGQGGTTTATINITVNGANDGPVAVVDQGATEESASINIDVLSNDTDIDSGAQLSIASFNAVSTLGAAISLNSNGTLKYDPLGSDTIQAMQNGETLSDTFTYTATDEHGATSTATVTVELSGGDDYIYGTPLNDEFDGTDNADTIVGLGGRDKIDGRDGDDIIYGDFVVEAPDGTDLSNLDNFKDDIKGGKGDDTLYGGIGDDKLNGQGNNDTLFGGDGNDNLKGGKGDDILVGGAGADKLEGGGGKDTFLYNSLSEGGDTVKNFETGKDTFKFDGEDFGGFGETTVQTDDDNFSIIGESGQSINFDADTNTLFYDSGVDGEGYQTIATVDGDVSADDIEII